MKQSLVMLVSFTWAFTVANAQTDTVKVCAYNLLNYGNSANTHAVKKAWLQPIMQFMKPGIVGVSEVSTALPGACDSLLPLMPFPAVRGTAYNTTGTTQLNDLFWHADKFTRLRDTSICNSTRDITAYELYWNYPDLGIYHDTVWLTVIVAHLKSSNSSADRSARAVETSCVSNYLSYLNKAANYIMLGDFNLYTSTETAYQNLTSPVNTKARLNDPINRPGNWDGDSTFKDIFTQSPRLAALSDGGASGGLDSRFDFILVSDPMLSGSKGIRYLPNSYAAIGNDGQHYHKALTDLPLNTAVSQAMAQHLYNMSDHLPVVASFAFRPPHLIPAAGISKLGQDLRASITVQNPFSDVIRLQINADVSRPVTYQLLSLQGSVIQHGALDAAVTTIPRYAPLSPGLYFLRLQDGNGSTAAYKLIHR